MKRLALSLLLASALGFVIDASRDGFAASPLPPAAEGAASSPLSDPVLFLQLQLFEVDSSLLREGGPANPLSGADGISQLETKALDLLASWNEGRVENGMVLLADVAQTVTPRTPLKLDSVVQVPLIDEQRGFVGYDSLRDSFSMQLHSVTPDRITMFVEFSVHRPQGETEIAARSMKTERKGTFNVTLPVGRTRVTGSMLRSYLKESYILLYAKVVMSE